MVDFLLKFILKWEFQFPSSVPYPCMETESHTHTNFTSEYLRNCGYLGYLWPSAAEISLPNGKRMRLQSNKLQLMQHLHRIL